MQARAFTAQRERTMSIDQNLSEENIIQYSEKQAAKLLNLSPKTLQKYRIIGGGPRFIRVSARCVRYRIVDLRVWQESKLVSSTSEPCPGDVSNTPGKARRVK